MRTDAGFSVGGRALTAATVLALALASPAAAAAQGAGPTPAVKRVAAATPAPKIAVPKIAVPKIAAPAKVAAVSKAATPALEEAPEPELADPDRDRILRLQQALISLVHGPVLGRLRVGMRVMDAATGRVFFRRRATTLMDPASNQKVLATAAALLRLGSGFRFRTELLAPPVDDDGVVHGDVVLRGSGDPSLTAADLERIAAQVAARGVRRIEGAVRSDLRRAGTTDPSPDERSPLRVSRGAVVVRVRPGGGAGEPPVVSVKPASEAFEVKNLAQTRAKGRSRVGVGLSTAGGRMVVTVSGRISLRHPGLVLRRVPPNQRLYAAALLSGALREAGVEVTEAPGLWPPNPPAPKRLVAETKAKVDTQVTPRSAAGATFTSAGAPNGLPAPERRDSPAEPEVVDEAPPFAQIAVHESAPLGVIVRRINKDSDNEYADRLLAVVGAEVYGGAATNSKGLQALRAAMTELALPPSSYVPANGSGLGHRNRVNADGLAYLLRALYLDPRIGPELMQSLSVGGIDGTTRNRFRGSPAAERVRAKTGTLRGKSALSGYVGDGPDVLVFSILIEGLRGRRLGTAAARSAQVQAVNAMMRYARGAVGELPVDEVAPGVDFEVGDEVLDADEEEPGAPEEAGQPDDSLERKLNDALTGPPAETDTPG